VGVQIGTPNLLHIKTEVHHFPLGCSSNFTRHSLRTWFCFINTSIFETCSLSCNVVHCIVCLALPFSVTFIIMQCCALSYLFNGPSFESYADHSPPSSAEVKNVWSYTSAPQYVLMGRYSVNKGHLHLNSYVALLPCMLYCNFNKLYFSFNSFS
jgi:hypothetical protein